MKKLLVLSLVAGLLPGVALAKGNHPMAGCGLAYFLFAKDDNSQGIQILASTTNNSLGTQSFGITSGTSGCTESGMVAKTMALEVYADVNFKSLQQEMAAGNGQYLSGFARLLSVKESQRPELYKFFQDKYAVLFPASDTTSSQMLDNLRKELSIRPDLLN